MRQMCAKLNKAQLGYLHPIGHLSLLGSWHLVKSCEVSTRQNKTLYKRLFNMSAKMEQTESIMKIYFQLRRSAAHFATE